jgi:PAS domain S-box-containing protein
MTSPKPAVSARKRAALRLLRRSAVPASVGALLLICAVIPLSVRQLATLVETRAGVDHTRRVIERLDEFLIDLDEAESQQRLYIITGDTLLRDSSGEALTVATHQINALATLTVDNAGQAPRLARLRRLTAARFNLMDSVNSLRVRGGFAPAAAVIGAGTGKAFMDSVRSTVADLSASERELLSQRTAREKESVRNTTRFSVIALLLAAALGLMAFFVTRRAMHAFAEGRRHARHIRAILDSTGEAIYGINGRGEITMVNAAMCRMLGYASNDLIGRAAHPLIHHTRSDGSAYPEYECPMYRAARDGVGGTFSDEIAWRVDGTSVPVEYSVSPLSSTGERGAVITFRDVTARRLAENALRRAKDDAERANEAKSTFLATMSHELRTPLNSVIGFANVLLRNKAGNLREQDVTYLTRIRDNGIHLLSLINDVLDLAKIEAGRTDIENEPIDLGALVREAAEQLEPQVDAKALRSVLDIPEHLEPIVSDRQKLYQVLTNLITNAVKFTASGSIAVRITADSDTGQPLSIEVEDSGIGIPADRIATVFRPFEQADQSTSRRFGGTGLGLPISRALCEMLGFTLTARSVVGEGSTFVVDLAPAPAAPLTLPDVGRAEEVGSETVLRGKRVLVIDDDPEARTILQQHIGDLGGVVISASSGEDGLRMARDQQPDLVTLDLLMPGMDGWEVVRLFNEDAELRRIPIVVVSAVIADHEARPVGTFDLVSKSLDRNGIARAMKQGLGLGRVLVVDDNADSRMLLAGCALEEGASEVRTASDGHEALAAVANFDPDLILLDLVMPRLDGARFLRELARCRAAGRCSVLMVTSKELTSGEDRELRLATIGVLKKGEHLEADLRTALREFVSQRRRDR